MKLKPLMIAACLSSTLAAGSAFAWPGKGHHMPDPAERAEHMQKALQLDDAQRKQIQKILEDSQKQRDALAQKYKISERDAYRKEMRTLHESKHGQIKALLNPAQQQALEAQHMRHGMKHKHGGDCPAHSKE